MNDVYIGIDLGGTRIKAGLVKDGVILDKQMISSQSATGLASSLPAVRSLVNGMLHTHADAGQLKGIALGFAGLVDPVRRKILSTNDKYNDALDLDLDGWIRSSWNVGWYIDNDARLAAVGEWQYGAGRGTDDLVVMTIGTGIGTSVISGGRVLRGKHFQAGCLGGHISIQYKGRPCNCGNRGCVETYASTWSLQQRITADPSYPGSSLSHAAVIDFATLFAAAAAGDSLARTYLDDCMEAWGTAVVNLIHAYDPEVVVIGGGVMSSADLILPVIREFVHRHAWTPWGKVDIRASSLLNDAGIYGAVYALQHSL